MPDKVFIDTNVLLYIYSQTEANKREIAITALEKNDCYTSTQALNEFCNVCTKKWQIPVEIIQKYLDEISAACTLSLVDEVIIAQALALHHRYKYSFYDCLMLSSALKAGCVFIMTEDLSDGVIIENRLTIKHIF